MTGSIKKNTGFTVNKMAKIAQAAVPPARKITDAKKESEQLASSLKFIRDKAQIVNRPGRGSRKTHKTTPKQKMLTKVITDMTELGLAKETSDGRPLSVYEQIGAQEAALRIIGTLEIKTDNSATIPKADEKEKNDLIESEMLDAAQRSSRIADSAGRIALDNSIIKEPAEGLKDRLTSKAEKRNAEHSAQRIQRLEETGLEAIRQISETENIIQNRFILAAQGTSHSTLEAVAQDLGQITCFDQAFCFDSPQKTRQHLQAYRLQAKGASQSPQTPLEFKAKYQLTCRMLKNVLNSAPRHKDSQQENGEYLGAYKVISTFDNAPGGAPADDIIARAAQDVLSPNYWAEPEVFGFRGMEFHPSEGAILRVKEHNQAMDEMKISSHGGGIAALKILAQGLNCQAAQKILDSNQSNREKLNLLKNFNK